MNDVKVPEGMLEAAFKAPYSEDVGDGDVRSILEAALRWLMENPIVPTDEQRAELGRLAPYEDPGNGKIHSWVAVEWQRRMFLAPEAIIPEGFPEEVYSLAWPDVSGVNNPSLTVKLHNDAVLEAFRRGQKAVSR